jgi:hypothetical protein
MQPVRILALPLRDRLSVVAVDPGYLRKHYASLSDDALLDIDRDELVDVARECLDAELRERHLEGQVSVAEEAEPREVDEELAEETSGEGEPDWFEEGAEVYSSAIRPGVTSVPQAHHARRALEAAGIPCYLDVYEEEPEPVEPVERGPLRRWRLSVPGHLNMMATGVLQRDIFNDEFEAGWRTHLEVLSDEEVRAMDPKVVFCGIYDQIERATKAYREELVRRRLV